uniref:Uncharacterized protein n=1 Tax=Anguilla anguilla TaxID=7936 RepID=A0A0E9XNX2_ANGAN
MVFVHPFTNANSYTTLLM